MDITADQIWAVASGVVFVASLITKFTPTPVDDGIASVARKVLDQLALNSGHAKNAEAVEAEKFRR